VRDWQCPIDGDLGSLAAIEVIQTLNEAGVTTRRPLEIVVWQNEEGYAFNNGIKCLSLVGLQKGLRVTHVMLSVDAREIW